MSGKLTYNEKELLAKMAAGDEHAFTSIYELTYPGLYYFAKQYVDEEKAKDIVAETYVKLWKSPRNFENLPHINSYIRAIARNACIDLLKREASESNAQAQLQYLTEEEYDATYFQRNELESLLYKKVLDEIEKLPASTRTIFKLSYLEGKKNAEISLLLNIKDQTVRNKKAEALKAIRISLLRLSAFTNFIRLFF